MSLDESQVCHSRRWWTVDEDNILRREVAVQLHSGAVSDWHRVAASLPSRSNKDCRKRWGKICSNVKKGAWDATEDRRLRAAVEKHGLCWTDVAYEVRTRHADQCAKRWQNSLNPNIVHTQWESDEDTRLMRAVEAHGRIWSKIAEEEFPRRSTTDIKNRHALLLRRRHRRRRGVRRRSKDSSSEQPTSELDTDGEGSPSTWNNVRPSDLNVPPVQPLQLDALQQTPLSVEQAWAQPSASAPLPLDGSPPLEAAPPGIVQPASIPWNTVPFDPNAPVLPSSSPPHFLDTPCLEHASSSPLSSSVDSSVPSLMGLEMPGFGGESSPSASSRITLILQDAEAHTLNKLLEILYEERVRYKLDVWHG